MDDVENEEDLRDLEVRLYGQVHHEPQKASVAAGIEPLAEATASHSQTTSSTSNSSGNLASNRYWAQNDGPVVSQHRKLVNPVSAAMRAPTASGKSSVGVITASTGVPSTQPMGGKNPTGSGATLSASGGGPEKKRGLNPFNAKNQLKKSVSEKLPVHKEMPERFMANKMRKLEQNKKMQRKRLKSKSAKQKQSKMTETIILESSEDEDIVVIPVPAPPVVTIDSSDEEKDKSEIETSTPKNRRSAGSRIRLGSRCNSPNSVMSDDFIVQQDKSRLLNETTVANDVDLGCLTIDNGTAIKHGAMEEATSNFATPNRRVSKARKTKPNYQVAQPNILAADVYESESSDMPESVYDKGKRTVPDAARQSSSSDDVEEIRMAPKTKKLRKRKASGSNKSSEPNDDDSTDMENEAENTATGLPYISRGEAVENYKRKIKRRQISSRDVDNAADKEFIDKLSNIVHGDDVDDDDVQMEESHESVHDHEENVTARTIAEAVLNASEKEATDEPSAIPEEAINDGNNSLLLKAIDSLSTSLVDYEEPIRHGRQPSPELFFEDLTNKETDDEEQSEAEVVEATSVIAVLPKEENKLDFMNVVYTNRDHVAWNDEMVRHYEYSWGQEKFNVDRMLRLMNRSADWSIKSSDRFVKSKKFSHLKCLNCCEFGHHRSRCPMPTRDTICYVCGDSGHREPRCPNTICLRCGKKTNLFTRSCKNCIGENCIVCPICKVRGHSIDLCPDKWRRYHSTTTINDRPNPKVVYNERKLCCICAGRGHLAEQCRSPWKLSEYHPSSSQIRSHSKTYDDVTVTDDLFNNGRVIGVNLMCNPYGKNEFPFSKKVTKHQYYGRFLSAVGLYEDLNEPRPVTKNYVVNPFAKDADIEKMKEEKKLIKKERKSKKPIECEDDIQLNIVGQVETNEEHDEVVEETVVEEAPQDNEMQSETSKPNGGAEELKEEDDSNVDKTGGQERDAAIMDSDSNYSFSEHFPKTESSTDAELVTARIPRTVGPLPDFIPIDGSDDDEPQKEQFSDDRELKNQKVDQDDNDAIEESETVCDGKIYVSKFHSKFLLSADGSKFLVENSKKHNIKVSMDWTAVGNVLVLEGIPKNQDDFHKELMDVLKKCSEEKSRNELEQSQKVPRKREALIKFLQDNILQLQKDLGNAAELNRKMKYNQSHYSRANFKAAERNRRQLNMILMGQAGFREGRMHLSILQDELALLQSEIQNENVPSDLREKIEIHWRYIFSSVNHCNYDQMVRQYVDMKKADKVPKLELNYKVLGKNALDVKFNEEQEELLMQPPAPPRIIPSTEIKTPRTEFGGKNRQMQANRQMSPQKGAKQTPGRSDGKQLNSLMALQFERQSPFQQRLNLNDCPMPPNFQQSNMSVQIGSKPMKFTNQQSNQPLFQSRLHNKQQPRQNQGNFTKPLICPDPPSFQNSQFFQLSSSQKQQQPQQSMQLFQRRMNQQQQPQQQQQQSQFYQNKPIQQPQQIQRFSQQYHQQQQPGNNNNDNTFVANQLREINNKWGKRMNDILDDMTSPAMQAKQVKYASAFWSRECLKILGQCMALDNMPIVQEKLVKLTQRASNNMLSFNDLKAIKRIYLSLEQNNNAMFENSRKGNNNFKK